MAYTYDNGWTAQNYLNAAPWYQQWRDIQELVQDPANTGRVVSFNEQPFTIGRDTLPTYEEMLRMLGTNMEGAGTKSIYDALTSFGADPNNMNSPIPDPIAGSLMPTGQDAIALSLLGALGGAAALGGAFSGVAGAAGAEGFGAGALGSLDMVGGLTAAESAALGGAGTLMPAAVPETAAQLAEWGLTETSPGVWSQAAMSGAGSALAQTLAQTVGSTAAKTALQKILSGDGTAMDYLSVLGSAAPGLLQAFGNYQSAQSVKDLAAQQKAQFDQFVGFGAPYRQRLSDLYANPGAYLQSPDVQASVQQGTDALARSLSAKVGNPIGNMTALGELQNYSANQLFGKLGQEKDRLAGFGGLSAYNQAGAGSPLATQLSQLGIGADAGVWGGLGRAAGDVFNPAPTTLTDLLKQMQGSNIFTVK